MSYAYVNQTWESYLAPKWHRVYNIELQSVGFVVPSSSQLTVQNDTRWDSEKWEINEYEGLKKWYKNR